MPGKGLFLTLAISHLHMEIKLAFLKNHWVNLIIFCMLAFRFMEMKIYKYNASQMTKMAAMPVYGKFPLKILFPGPQERLHWNFVWSIRDSIPSHFVQVITLGWPWPIFGKVRVWNLSFYIQKCDNDGFSGNYCSLWHWNWLIYLTKWVNIGISLAR